MTMQSPSISLDRVRRVTDPISTSHLGLGIIYYVDTYVHVGCMLY